jgi:hypothetical protein
MTCSSSHSLCHTCLSALISLLRGSTHAHIFPPLLFPPPLVLNRTHPFGRDFRYCARSRIVGSKVRTFLLERTRVTGKASDEGAFLV